MGSITPYATHVNFAPTRYLCYNCIMSLPPAKSEPSPLADLSVVSNVAQRAEVDKAIIDKALVREVAKDLPIFYERAKQIALTAEHDSDSVATLKMLFERAAGKPAQDVNLNGSLGVYQLPPAEVAQRVESLRLLRDNQIHKGSEAGEIEP